jgi:PKD repeat protein
MAEMRLNQLGLYGLAVVLGCCFAAGCQGANQNVSNPRPRSREAAGERSDLPYESETGSRRAVDSSGGEVEYRLCKLVVPRGAVQDAVFFEIAIPDEAQRDILPDSAYQINPDGVELLKDALLTLGYYDDDIPAGHDEAEIVAVHKVNNVWIELSNTKVNIHNNSVEVPIRYTGVYALRILTGDSRETNTPPVADFEFSDKPYPEASLKPVADAAGPPPADEQAADGQPGVTDEDGNAYKTNINRANIDILAELPGVSRELAAAISEDRKKNGDFRTVNDITRVKGVTGEIFNGILPYISVKTDEPLQAQNEQARTGGEQAEDGGGAEGAEAAQPAPAEAGAGGQAPAKPGQAAIFERHVVAGPEPPGGNPAQAQAPAAETGGDGSRNQDQGGSAGNVAEGNSPGAGQPAKSAGDDEAPTGSPEKVAGEGAITTVYFNASASHDPDGAVVQYDWDFDSDGVFDYTSHATAFAEHTYTFNGDYTVSLKVSDNGRYQQCGYTTGVVRVRNAKAPPQKLSAHINAYPASGVCPLTAYLSATVTGGTAPYDYDWTFTDGSKSNLPNPYTTYPESGSHTIKFSVTDIKGETLNGSVLVDVQAAEHPRVPLERMLLDISPTTERGYAPLQAKFSLLSERSTAPVTYRVSYGDEPDGADPVVTTSPVLSHTYSASGFYLVKIIATDAELRTASTFATVNVSAPGSPRDFTQAETQAAGDPFSFGHHMHIRPDITEASKRTVKFWPEQPPSALEQLSLQWDFGDGTFSTDAKPTHSYAKDGVYEVRLSANNGTERWRTRIWLPIGSGQPAAAIQRPFYIEGPAPYSLALDAIATRAQEPLKYKWQIGDAQRTDATTVYTFAKPGEYDVNLSVFDKDNTEIKAPRVHVVVRPPASDYRLPIAVQQPLSGSTRSLVLDYTAANPQPYSSPSSEGPVALVNLSSNGQYLAEAGQDWLLVKQINDGSPVLSFLPANGELVAARALDYGGTYATVDTANGLRTYLLRPDCNALLVGNGILAAASGDGGVVVLKSQAENLGEGQLYMVDVSGGQVGEPRQIGGIYEAALPRDGRELWAIDAQYRLLRRELASGSDSYYGSRDDRKSGLAVSAEGNAAVFCSTIGDKSDIIYGRFDEAGDFRLASVTAQTGWFSAYLALSADGMYLLSYGQRQHLSELVQKARGSGAASAGEDELAPEAGEATGQVPLPAPPKRRERFGLVRFDLSPSPTDWSITKVNPKFLVECAAQFSSAGPF